MKVNLFISYYIDKNEDRRKELLTCLENNLTNTSIDQVVLFTNRPTYKMFFEATSKYPHDINIIANSDIYFDESLKMLIDFFGKCLWSDCLALTRWDKLEDGSLQRYIDRGSQDTWVFYGAVQNIDRMFCDFHLGIAGCDNRIAYELQQVGYNVLNPSEDIRTLHLHNSQIRNYNPGRKIPGPHLLFDATKLENINETQYYKRTIEEIAKETTEDWTLSAASSIAIQQDSSLKIQEPMDKKQIRVLHIALMAGDNGFTSEFKKLGEYQEINYHAVKNEYGVIGMNEIIKQTAKSFNPDLIFCQLQEGNLIQLQTFHEISKTSYVIVWTGDIRHQTPDYLIELSNTVNCVSFSNERDTQLLASKFLQIGIDPDIFKTIDVSQIALDQLNHAEIVFMGNHYGEGHFPLSSKRLQMVEEMKTEFGSNFTSYGNHSEINLAHSQSTENLHYNMSKIGISYSHFEEERYFSDRLLRIMASGCMALSHHYSGIEKDFEIGVHLDVFHSLEELKYKCYHYLNNETKRKQIAEAGQKLVHHKFTFKNMVENIYKLYSESNEK